MRTHAIFRIGDCPGDVEVTVGAFTKTQPPTDMVAAGDGEELLYSVFREGIYLLVPNLPNEPPPPAGGVA